MKNRTIAGRKSTFTLQTTISILMIICGQNFRIFKSPLSHLSKDPGVAVR